MPYSTPSIHKQRGGQRVSDLVSRPLLESTQSIFIRSIDTTSLNESLYMYMTKLCMFTKLANVLDVVHIRNSNSITVYITLAIGAYTHLNMIKAKFQNKHNTYMYM